MKTSYAPDKNPLIDVSQYRILQQSALEMCEMTLQSLSPNSQSEIASGGFLKAKSSESLISLVMKSRETKKKQLSYLEAMNQDINQALLKIKTDQYIEQGPK